jgi:pyridoxamine 5'-phosphate oxidase family protein
LFSEPEINYLKSQNLLRIGTVSKSGQPDVVPVGFEFDGMYFWVGSNSQDVFLRSHKYKNVKNGNKKVSFTIDDLESVDPWKPRLVKVNGTAEVEDHQGEFGQGKYLKITPKVSWSFGIKGLDIPAGQFFKKTEHTET